jgi:hypothetical protein
MKGAGETAADAGRGDGPASRPLSPGLCRARGRPGLSAGTPGGPQRRARLREKGRAYWHTTETLLGSVVQNGAHPSDSRRREDAHAAHQT